MDDRAKGPLAKAVRFITALQFARGDSQKIHEAWSLQLSCTDCGKTFTARDCIDDKSITLALEEGKMSLRCPYCKSPIIETGK